MSSDFRLPDIGEGISEASLVEWLIAVGDTVEEGDDVAVVSTDKADVELASPRSGTVAQLCWTPGDLVKVGEVLLIFEGEAHNPAIEAAPALVLSSRSRSAEPLARESLRIRVSFDKRSNTITASELSLCLTCWTQS